MEEKEALTENTKMRSQSNDSVARVFAILALFFGILALFTSLGSLSWIHFRVSTLENEMKLEPDSNKMKTEVESLKNMVQLLQIELGSLRANHLDEEIEPPANFTKVLKRSKRAVAKPNPNAVPDAEIGYGTAVYVRWGRTQCREGSTTIYSGVAAGGYSGHTGGGSNYQCLPNEPQFDYVNPGVQYATSVGGSAIYGVEFKLNNIDPFINSFNGGKTMNNEDSTCATCLVNGKTTALMIPGQTSCPKGWTKEYKGYLMAPHFKQHRMNYVCVDETPEPRNAGENTSGGVYWYPVEIQCGAIPCPKYSNGQELSCVVCSK